MVSLSDFDEACTKFKVRLTTEDLKQLHELFGEVPEGELRSSQKQLPNKFGSKWINYKLVSQSLGLHQGSFKYINQTFSANLTKKMFKLRDCIQTIEPVLGIEGEHTESFATNPKVVRLKTPGHANGHGKIHNYTIKTATRRAQSALRNRGNPATQQMLRTTNVESIGPDLSDSSPERTGPKETVFTSKRRDKSLHSFMELATINRHHKTLHAKPERPKPEHFSYLSTIQRRLRTHGTAMATYGTTMNNS